MVVIEKDKANLEDSLAICKKPCLPNDPTITLLSIISDKRKHFHKKHSHDDLCQLDLQQSKVEKSL